MPLALGTHLGTYEILSPLGAGGMGEVYRARDTRLGREVAVKVMPEAVANRPDRLAQFEQEARAVAALNHPNIITLYSIEEEEGVRFLTMELVEGRTLDRIVSPGGLPLSQVLDITIPLAAALVAAHEKGIVHRDLKPKNVMMTHDGRVKVLDFGLARLAPTVPKPTEETLTAAIPADPIAGGMEGTLPYMAPEQIRQEPVDARADLFALGIVIYELVTGHRPFEGVTVPDLTSAILRDAPVAVTTLREDVPHDLGRIIGRCLEKDRERRVQTAKDVMNELNLVRRELTPRSLPAVRTLPPAVSTRGIPSIAVLPFVNRSRDAEDEYFSDGLADELLNVLSKIRGLRVAARTSSFQFKGKSESLAVIGQRLNVATILDGSVRKSGNRVRIAVQLLNVSDGYHLWSEVYDRTLQDIFAVQDDIAQSVVGELRTMLVGEAGRGESEAVKADVAVAARGRGDVAEAHRLYLQARYLGGLGTHESVARAVTLMQEAIDIDPGHALAWAWLSRSHMRDASFNKSPLAEGVARARKAAEHALALEPDLGEGHACLGAIQARFDWDWDGAELSYRRALDQSPGSADVVRSAGALARILGRQEESIKLLRRAVDLDPLNPTCHLSLGHSYRDALRFPEAEAAYRMVLELAPKRSGVRSYVGLAVLLQGRAKEGLAETELESDELFRLLTLTVIYLNENRRTDSDRTFREMIEKHSDSAAYQIAEVHAVSGERDAAFEWLDRAYARRDSGLPDVKADLLFRPIHDDPRWGAFLVKMGFGR